MTLLTTPPAAGTPPASLPSNAPPSSGSTEPKAGEQQAAGKESPPTGDQPKEGEKAPANNDTGRKPEGDKPKGAPETYTFKPSADGAKLGGEVQTALSAVARELDLTNDAAQKIVDGMAPALLKQSQANIKAMVDGWAEETKNDPVIGGDKLKETLSLANKGLALGTPGLRQLLDETGLGNHKEVITFLAQIGRKVSPDTRPVTGNTPTPPAKDVMTRLAESYTAP